MHTTVDERKARNRDSEHRADIAEDVAYLVVLVSLAILVLAIIVAAFAI
jgi:hypothetical protein